MKKKLFAGILTATLIIAGASVALGATDQSKLNDIKALYQQIFDLQKQVIQKQAEAGTITQDQATYWQNMLDQREKYQDQALDNGTLVGPGMMGGFGGGLGCGGYGGNGTTPAPSGKTGYGFGYGRGMMGGSWSLNSNLTNF